MGLYKVVPVNEHACTSMGIMLTGRMRAEGSYKDETQAKKWGGVTGKLDLLSAGVSKI